MKKGALEEGREEGLEKGREEERLTIAKAMKANDVSIDIIIRSTGLSAEEVAQL